MGKRSTIVALALAAVSALVIASAAGEAIRTVTFDDLAANTRVSTEYQSSHGVAFVSDPGVSPLVKSFPGKAHSGDKVGVYSCEGLPGCGEGFSDPQLRGTLTTTATSVSTYVGFWVDPAFPGAGQDKLHGSHPRVQLERRPRGTEPVRDRRPGQRADPAGHRDRAGG